MDEKNISLEIANEVIEEYKNEKCEFVIDTDQKAEWALKKIAEERLETQRYINVCNLMISDYNEKIKKSTEKLENKISFLQSKLQHYFKLVQHNITSTQETYKLPSGTLRLKYQKPEFVRDDGMLIQWLKDNELHNFVKIEEKVNWAKLKKIFKVHGENIVSDDGQVIEGVKAKDKPPILEIDT